MDDVILQVENLKAYFKDNKSTIKAVDGVSFTVHRGEKIGIIGESGSGKSVTCLSLLKLKKHNEETLEGKIIFEGKDIFQLDKHQLQKLRGKEISIIFQDPKTSINPFFKISTEMIANIRRHQRISKKEARAKAIDMLRLVNFPDPERRIDDYPERLSGGQRQRVQIAMALSQDVKLLIADEATAALDATIQAQIITLLEKISTERNMALIIVTHNLGIAAGVCDRINVMYSGHIVESASTEDLFDSPLHPYTKALIEDARNMDLSIMTVNEKKERFSSSGCPYHDKCRERKAKCKDEYPGVKRLGKDHMVSCWLYEDEEDE